MTTLAIDPGVSYLGWCRSDGQSGTMLFKPYQDRGEALCGFQNWLGNQMADGISLLAIERPGFRMNARDADFVYGVVWAAHSIAFRFDVPRREMRADSVRKALIGRARRLKGESDRAFDAVIREAVRERGFSPESEHAVDAAALLCAVSGGENRLPPCLDGTKQLKP